jgi:hypothetical protein
MMSFIKLLQYIRCARRRRLPYQANFLVLIKIHRTAVCMEATVRLPMAGGRAIQAFYNGRGDRSDHRQHFFPYTS